MAFISRVTFCRASVISTCGDGWHVSWRRNTDQVPSTHLLLEVLQHVLAAAPQVGLQQDGVPLLVVHGLGDLAAQEPEEEVADAFALGEGRRGGTDQRERRNSELIRRIHPSVLRVADSLNCREFAKPKTERLALLTVALRHNNNSGEMTDATDDANTSGNRLRDLFASDV